MEQPLKRPFVKSDWVNGKYITMLKYDGSYIDVSILNEIMVKQIEEWCKDAVSKAYELGLKEGAEIAKIVYKEGKV